MPYFWLWFALTYTKQIESRPWLPTLLYTLAILPFTTIFLVFTNEWHNLLWTDVTLTYIGDLLQLQLNYGAWFWVHFVISYLSLLAGTLVLLRGLWVKQELYRAQFLALMVAILAPWVSNILFFINQSPIPGLDLTPFAFTITIVALAWSLFRHQLINIAPIARDLIVEGMREGVLVINQQGRIADINPAAAYLIGLPGEQSMGKEATEVLAPWPNLLLQLDKGGEAQGEIVAGQMLYQFQIAPLNNANEQMLGQVITTRARTTAVSNALTPPTTPKPPPPTSTTPKSPASRGQRLLRFFIPPPLTDTTPLKGENIILSRLLEQAFTAMLRFALVLAYWL
jgi:PAS domain-containing protein